MSELTPGEMTREHTKEMVTAAMGYVLGKLAEDPTWLLRMDLSASLASAVTPDAEIFMTIRGNYAADDLAFEALACRLRQRCGYWVGA